jgi:signal transduction histidine kinase
VALLATGLVSFVYDALGFSGGFYTIALGVALYSAAAADRRWAAIIGAVTIVITFSAVGLLLGRGHFADQVATPWFTGWLIASVAIGEVMRGRQRYLEEAERRASEAERSREEEARRRAGEERIRIARELHDILAHTISTIAVQSGVALHLMDKQPERARSALANINQASHEALQDLHETLGVLRQAGEPEPRAPSSRLAQLNRLVANAVASGVAVGVDVRGEARELPSSVDLAAYRIIQEALTNIVRHAHSATARLALTYGAADLVIEIDDDGRGVAPEWHGMSGNGLQGMRERALTLGGTLEAGPRPAGGFAVRATLPISSVA